MQGQGHRERVTGKGSQGQGHRQGHRDSSIGPDISILDIHKNHLHRNIQARYLLLVLHRAEGGKPDG